MKTRYTAAIAGTATNLAIINELTLAAGKLCEHAMRDAQFLTVTFARQGDPHPTPEEADCDAVASVLYLPHYTEYAPHGGRLIIWCNGIIGQSDVDDLEDGLDLFLNDLGEFEARNTRDFWN